MRFDTTPLLLLSLALSTNASWLIVSNYCRKPLWIADANQTNWTPPTQKIPSGTSYISNITGEGNQLGISVIEDYYNDKTPRFIMGTSVKDKVLWWTVNQLGSDPFEGEPFNVTSTSKPCGFTKGYNLDTHNCPDGDFALELNVCVENS